MYMKDIYHKKNGREEDTLTGVLGMSVGGRHFNGSEENEEI